MNKLASRPATQVEIENTDFGRWAWLPEEAPLAMPRQSLSAPEDVADAVPATSPINVGARRLMLLAGTVVLTGLSAIAPFYLYARKGWDGTEIVAFGLFMVLIFGSRFVLEIFKTPQAAYEANFSITVGQWLSVPFILLGIVMMLRAKTPRV